MLASELSGVLCVSKVALITAISYVSDAPAQYLAGRQGRGGGVRWGHLAAPYMSLGTLPSALECMLVSDRLLAGVQACGT